jgi:hypothetical protein
LAPNTISPLGVGWLPELSEARNGGCSDAITNIGSTPRSGSGQRGRHPHHLCHGDAEPPPEGDGRGQGGLVTRCEHG